MRSLKALPLLLFVIICLFPFSGKGQNTNTKKSDEIFSLNSLKTFGTAGKEKKLLTAGKEAELFQYKGKGCLTHMWFGGDWPGYEKTRLRIYVDGEVVPSINMEMGLGHGIGFNDTNAPWGISKMGKTGHPSGIYNTYRIPFGKSVRVTAQLGIGVKDNPEFWWIIRGSENLPVTIGGIKLPEEARLKLYKRENYLAKRLEEFDLCKTTKAGCLYQVMIAARSENLNFLEAIMRAYINGKEKPLLLSSGLEDYFLGTYYFNRGKYSTPVAGLTHIDEKDNSFSAYRFHDDDPVFFQKGIRLTTRCGEQEGDKIFGDPKETMYTTYVWTYEW
jgi:hypothetical protein